jgi:hypothetical protein
MNSRRLDGERTHGKRVIVVRDHNFGLWIVGFYPKANIVLGIVHYRIWMEVRDQGEDGYRSDVFVHKVFLSWNETAEQLHL